MRDSTIVAVLAAAIVCILILAGFTLREESQQKSECKTMSGRYASGGKYGDDLCVAQDGRIIKIW
jgi:hypothetical protein